MRVMAHRDIHVNLVTRQTRSAGVQIQPKILKHGDDHPSVRAALKALADTYGITDDEVFGIELHAEVGRAITITPSLFLPGNVDPELLRERASRLLSAANRLEQERICAPERTPVFDLAREQDGAPQA